VPLKAPLPAGPAAARAYAAAPAAGRDPALLRRWTLLLGLAVLLWPLLVLTEFKPWQLLDERSLRSTGRFLAQFVPPRADAEFLGLLARETWRTVAIATAGLALAWVIAVPLAIGASARLSVSAIASRMGAPQAALRQLLRWTAVLLRSVPELVWALLFVRVVGLGPTAGVLAIGIAYGGMLGKVYSEILESADELLSYTVYRWECAIRSSVVLGFVGAGGLGQQLDNAAKMFAGAEVSSILLVFIALVALSDRLSAALRRGLD